LQQKGKDSKLAKPLNQFLKKKKEIINAVSRKKKRNKPPTFTKNHTKPNPNPKKRKKER
jgi:hypothetical protein